MARGHGGQVMPAIWFRYDLTPITVAYTENRKPAYHFLTMVSIQGQVTEYQNMIMILHIVRFSGTTHILHTDCESSWACCTVICR